MSLPPLPQRRVRLMRVHSSTGAKARLSITRLSHELMVLNYIDDAGRDEPPMRDLCLHDEDGYRVPRLTHEYPLFWARAYTLRYRDAPICRIGPEGAVYIIGNGGAEFERDGLLDDPNGPGPRAQLDGEHQDDVGERR